MRRALCLVSFRCRRGRRARCAQDRVQRQQPFADAWRYPEDCAAPAARALRNRPAPERPRRRDSSAASRPADSIPGSSVSGCGFTERTGTPSRMVRSSGSSFALLRVTRTCTSTFCPGASCASTPLESDTCTETARIPVGTPDPPRPFPRKQAAPPAPVRPWPAAPEPCVPPPAAAIRRLRRASAPRARGSTGRLFRPARFPPESAWRPPPPSCRCPCCCSICSRTSRRRRRWR